MVYFRENPNLNNLKWQLGVPLRRNGNPPSARCFCTQALMRFERIFWARSTSFVWSWKNLGTARAGVPNLQVKAHKAHIYSYTYIVISYNFISSWISYHSNHVISYQFISFHFISVCMIVCVICMSRSSEHQHVWLLPTRDPGRLIPSSKSSHVCERSSSFSWLRK